MRYLKIAVVVGLALAALTVQARVQSWVLWGTQTHSWVTSYQRWSGEPVVLPKAARITAVETNAHSFCVWSAGKAVLCGSDTSSIEGKVLDKGRYTVFPDLAPAQKHCEVVVYLEEVK